MTRRRRAVTSALALVALAALLLLGRAVLRDGDALRGGPGDGAAAGRVAGAGPSGAAGPAVAEEGDAAKGLPAGTGGTAPSPGPPVGEAEPPLPAHLPPDEAAGAEPPPLRPGIPVPETLRVRLVDAETGRPIPGARVLVATWFPGDTSSDSWYGGNTGADGGETWEMLALMLAGFADSADRRERERVVREDVRLEWRIKAPGYRSLRAPVESAEGEIRLERLLVPLQPGTVRGRLLRPDGSAGSGRLRVSLADGIDGHYEGMWTEADAAGGFLLEGVDAGPWRLSVSGESRWASVDLPSGGSTAVDLVGAGNGLAEGGDVLPEETREVLVEVPAGEAAWGGVVRAEVRERHAYRALVVGGVARFPALPVRTWRFVLARPGEPDLFREDAVLAGDGPQRIPLSSAPTLGASR